MQPRDQRGIDPKATGMITVWLRLGRFVRQLFRHRREQREDGWNLNMTVVRVRARSGVSAQVYAHDPQHKRSIKEVTVPLPCYCQQEGPDAPLDNEYNCGFVCPSCNFEMRLSDPSVGRIIIEAFHDGSDSAHINCPECNLSVSFTRRDLRRFLPGGKVLPFL